MKKKLATPLNSKRQIHKNIYRFSLYALVLLSSISSWAQYTIPEKPDTANPDAVYDYINLLTSSQKQTLENKLIRYSDTTGTQIVIAIISSTKGEDIALLGAKWGQKWGVGQAKEDNGIFITVAKDDRQVDINTGYGIEYIISDSDAERLINQVMIPHFKKGNFYTGLDQATNTIFKHLQGNYKGERQQTHTTPIEPIAMFIIFIVLIIILSKGNKKGGDSGGTGRHVTQSLLDVIILSNMGRGGFSGGSWGNGNGGFGGSGGFGGGFGGGGFGGGGASGGW